MNTANGDQLWNYTTGDAVGSLAISNGVVYVGSNNGNLYALDAANGNQLWSYPTGGAVGSPAISNGIVYVGSNNGNLYALDAANGNQLWNYTTGGAVGSPAISNGLVWVGSGDGNLYAFNTTDGNQLWNYPIPAEGSVGSPAISNGVVYVGSNSGNLYAFAYIAPGVGSSDSSSIGEWSMFGINLAYARNYPGFVNVTSFGPLWNYTTGGAVGSPAISNGVVYVGSDDENLYALNATNGSQLWNYTTYSLVDYSPASQMELSTSEVINILLTLLIRPTNASYGIILQIVLLILLQQFTRE